MQLPPVREQNARRTVLLVLLALNSFAYGLNDGDLAPLPKTALTAGGKKISPATYAESLKKKNLLLVFYRTGTCGVCVNQLVEIAETRDVILKWNTAILAVSVDDAIVQSQTKDKIGDSFPLLLDPEAKMAKAFDVFNPSEQLARPAVFLIGSDRKILYHHVGQTSGDRPSRETLLHTTKHHSGLSKRAAKR